MKKKTLILIGLVIAIISMFFITLRSFNTNNYEQSKKKSIEFLNSNINNLQNIANEMILNKSKESENHQKR